MQSIRDLRKTIKLPPNDFATIDDQAAAFDDMRICYVCKQICVFSAVACECDNHKVSCMRHSTMMCKCSMTKKFLLGMLCCNVSSCLSSVYKISRWMIVAMIISSTSVAIRWYDYHLSLVMFD